MGAGNAPNITETPLSPRSYDQCEVTFDGHRYRLTIRDYLYLIEIEAWGETRDKKSGAWIAFNPTCRLAEKVRDANGFKARPAPKVMT